MPLKITAALLAGAALCAPAARAADSAPTYTFSGYGTLGLAHSSESQADFKDRLDQPRGAGHSNNWSFDTDSRLAGQLEANWDRQWSAVLQVVAEQQSDNTYRPAVEWINVQFMPSPNLSIRAGRIAVPNLLLSNSRKVGYSLPWVRMPSAMYQLLPMSSSDGVDASYSEHIGGIRNTLMVNAGKKTFDVHPSSTVVTAHAKKIRSVTDALVSGALTLQLSYEQLENVINGVPTPLSLKFNSLGASYDPGHWFVMGEWAKLRMPIFADSTSWYVGAGYRLDDFTPYVIYNDRSLGKDGSALIQPQRTRSAGLRWDMARNVDLKLQYDHNRMPPGSPGVLINVQPGFRPGGAYHLVSATVDFTF